MDEPKKGLFINSLIAFSAAITAIAGTTTLAYFVFQGIRHTPFETLLDSSFRVLQGMTKAFLHMDPFVAAWAIPLVLGFVAIIGILIYQRLTR